MFSRQRPAQRILILGTGKSASMLAEALLDMTIQRTELVGAVSEQDTGHGTMFPCPILGSLNQLESIIARYKPQRIVIALTQRRGHMPAAHLVQARVTRSIVIEDVVDAYERLTGKLLIDSMTPSDVIFSHNFNPNIVQLYVARMVSVLAAILGLICSAPLLLLIALIIKCDSRGPILFVQERTGAGGKSYHMFKFRTMHPSAQHKSEWVRDNNTRITRVGYWLRRFRLDELPQFINILRGDMNLVGPRPHPRCNFELFTLVSRNTPLCGAAIPFYALRSMIRPGITGWAQVRYRYANDLDEEIEKLCYDLYYIKHYSLWLDMKILLQTLKVVFFGEKHVTEIQQPSEMFSIRASKQIATVPLARLNNNISAFTRKSPQRTPPETTGIQGAQ